MGTGPRSGSGAWELQVGGGSGQVGRHLTVPAIHQLQGLHIMRGDTLLQQHTAQVRGWEFWEDVGHIWKRQHIHVMSHIQAPGDNTGWAWILARTLAAMHGALGPTRSTTDRSPQHSGGLGVHSQHGVQKGH